MPLLEINQAHYISASVRLDEATAEQVDQRAAFVHASADDVLDKALRPREAPLHLAISVHRMGPSAFSYGVGVPE